MTFAEVLHATQQLSSEERILLARLLLESENTNDDITPPGVGVPPLASLGGFLKPDGPMLTDEDIERILLERLEEKYL